MTGALISVVECVTINPFPRIPVTPALKTQYFMVFRKFYKAGNYTVKIIVTKNNTLTQN